MLSAGRILNGVCVGIISSEVPVYLAEIAEKEKRGAVVIIQQLTIGENCRRGLQYTTTNRAWYRMGYLYVFCRLWL